MKKNEKTNSNANNEKNNVVLSSVTFAAAKDYKQNQNLSFSTTIKNLGAPYAPANKNFSPDTLKLYGIGSDSSINCFRAILLDEGGKYKIYRALDKYTTTKGAAAKLLKAFETFTASHDFSNICTMEAKSLLDALKNEAAKEEAAKELQRKERERAKEAAKIEMVMAKVTDANARDAMMEQLKKQLAALQNMQF